MWLKKTKANDEDQKYELFSAWKFTKEHGISDKGKIGFKCLKDNSNTEINEVKVFENALTKKDYDDYIYETAEQKERDRMEEIK
eukprot:CAMPEP_0116887328 /NCGR_PEP_ID=MMETSP0463-20121206/21732_1 /TAXON_ID=181622 /ORGANISM="Strombidinopsis sp, Strain SopsisLIS2011" /LENGTH=83 /DNA_ID=CAMNT_0004549747 /DNA_START=2749 /DNA_END=3000 /DNA_ORIENTATION=+